MSHLLEIKDGVPVLLPHDCGGGAGGGEPTEPPQPPSTRDPWTKIAVIVRPEVEQFRSEIARWIDANNEVAELFAKDHGFFEVFFANEDTFDPDLHVAHIQGVGNNGVEGAAGYHQRKVYGTDIDAWAYTDVTTGPVTFSHENFEVMGNRMANKWIAMPGNQWHAYEVCDPVSGAAHLTSNGVPVSAWVSDYYLSGDNEEAPYFDSAHHFGGDPFIFAPGQLGPGGFQIVYDAINQQIIHLTENSPPPHLKAHCDVRMARMQR